MYIYLPDGFIVSQNFGGICWKHCNFYKWLFSCNCQWKWMCTLCFYITLVFLVCLFFGFWGGMVKHRIIFLKKVIFGQWLFQLDITCIQPSKEVCFLLFCLVNLLKNRDFISSVKKAFHYPYKSLQRAQTSS